MTATALIDSRPYFTAFSPDVIPWQREVVDLIELHDYSLGHPEILLSGSYGSAKSTLLVHLAIVHCLENPGAVVAIGRKAMPDLKKTVWTELLDHMSEDFIEGEDYDLSLARTEITFANGRGADGFEGGSKIMAVSWHDGRYKKFRSLKISMLIIEEMVENDADDYEAFKQLKARLKRIPTVKRNLFIGATNPDEPDHWVHEYFIAPNSNGMVHPTRFVFYSRSDQNPFLDKTYLSQLMQDMSHKEVQRFLFGQWITLQGNVIYSEYESEAQFKRTVKYKPTPGHPIILTFDFNIAEGKPMSAIMAQFINDEFHFFNPAIIEGARTQDIIDDWDGRDVLDPSFEYWVCGDASGSHSDTRSKKSDYDIIKKGLSNLNLRFVYKVPLANPPIRKRHNVVNAYCLNGNKQRRLWFYSGCEVADEGMRLTKLKKGGNYIENDNFHAQHVTTAIGYAIIAAIKATNKSVTAMRDL